MANLIRFEDGVMVEVAAPTGGTFAPVSAGSADRISAQFSDSAHQLSAVIAPIAAMLQRAMEGTRAKEAEVELSVGFSAEGSIFVSKVTAEANLKVTIKYGIEN